MRRILVSFFVLLGIGFGTFLAFQFWQESPSQFQTSNIITFSNPITVQSLNVPEGKRLVPIGSILGINDVESVTFTYLVEAEEEQDLNVLFSNVTFSKNGMKTLDEYGLLLFSYVTEIVNEHQRNVIVTVSIAMPETQEQYLQLSGSHVSFQVNFLRG